MQSLLAAQRDLGIEGTMVRGLSDAAAVQYLRRCHSRRRGGKHAVKRQKGLYDRKGWLGGAREGLADKGRRQRHPAPDPPFIQIARQNGGPVVHAVEILANCAHLREPQPLPQGQVGANQTQPLTIAPALGHNRAPMASPRQVDQRDAVHLDPRGQKKNGAKKPVARLRPTMAGVMMRVAQPGHSLYTSDIQDPAMRAGFFIGLLQDQCVSTLWPDLVAQHIQCPVWVHLAIVAAAPVDVPADAGKVGWVSHRLRVAQFAQRRPAPLHLQTRAAYSLGPIQSQRNKNVCC